MSTYSGNSFLTQLSTYLIYRGSATAAALNLSQPKIGWVFDITEGGTLTNGNITVQAGDAVMYLKNGWAHCNNAGADQAIAQLTESFNELLEEIGDTDFSNFALKNELPTVPTKTSQLQNDSGFLTQHQSLASYALKTEIPDISNKAESSELTALAERVTNNEEEISELKTYQPYVPQVVDFSAFNPRTGEIVQYIGNDTEEYKKGFFYKYDNTEIIIPQNTRYIILENDYPTYPKGLYKEVPGQYNYVIGICKTYITELYTNLSNLAKQYLGEINFSLGSEVGDFCWDEMGNLFIITEFTISPAHIKATLWKKNPNAIITGNGTNINLSDYVLEEFESNGFRVPENPTKYYARSKFQNDNGDFFYATLTTTNNLLVYCGNHIKEYNNKNWLICGGALRISAKFHNSKYDECLNGDYIEANYLPLINTENDTLYSTPKWERINVQPEQIIPDFPTFPTLSFNQETFLLKLMESDNQMAYSQVDLSALKNEERSLRRVDLYLVAEEGETTETPYFKLTFAVLSSESEQIVRVPLSLFGGMITISVDNQLSATSENPVQNKVIYEELDKKVDKEYLDNIGGFTPFTCGNGLELSNEILRVKTDGTSIIFDSNGNLKAVSGGAITVDSALSTTSENPVQNKVVKAALDLKTTDSTLATVAKTGSYNDLTDKPTIPAAVTIDSTITQNSTNPVQGGAIYTALSGKVENGGGCNTIIVLTQTQYDNLATKDENTWYAIPEETTA